LKALRRQKGFLITMNVLSLIVWQNRDISVYWASTDGWTLF